MSFTQRGKVKAIYAEKQVSEKFKTREFVLEMEEEINGNSYVDYAKMQFVQQNCIKLDAVNIGDTVDVTFVIKGRPYTDKKDGSTQYMSANQAFKIDVIQKAPQSDL